MNTRLHDLILNPRIGRIALSLLAIVYVIYLGGFARFVVNTFNPFSSNIVDHAVGAAPDIALNYWTTDSMNSATSVDEQDNNPADFSQQNTQAQAVQQEGHPPVKGDASYPLSTVGRIFFTGPSGQNMSCSGTAVDSNNHSVVDTAGHCLYWNGGWVSNLIFCPLFDHGTTPYGCWAAQRLEVPADWIDARPNDLHHDLGMAVVAPNAQGQLTDVVGGAGWAYNQPTNSTFYAFGYPAAPPFDGLSRKSCDGAQGRSWQHAGGTVISIPCGMNGGSSGGPWFIKQGNNWYLSGHNDFSSSIQPGHMFSPYYDDTWHNLYEKAQNA